MFFMVKTCSGLVGSHFLDPNISLRHRHSGHSQLYNNILKYQNTQLLILPENPKLKVLYAIADIKYYTNKQYHRQKQNSP